MDNYFVSSNKSEPFDFLEGFESLYKVDDDDGVDPLQDPCFMAFLNSFTPAVVVEKKERKSGGLTRMGRCEHPKHIVYRQDKYATLSATTSKEASRMKAVPRRGRPPKGYISPATVPAIVKLTVRPLPKRLEKVVGKTNIKVCLTCLKKSDVDPDYVHHHAYVGPQHLKKP